MMAAILICGTTTVTLSSCSEDDNATPTGGIEIEPTTEEVEPTTDQMAVSVTANVPASVLSQFDDNSTGAAFVKRLPETSGEITDQTRLVVVKGSDALTIVWSQVCRCPAEEAERTPEQPLPGEWSAYQPERRGVAGGGAPQDAHCQHRQYCRD